MKPTLFAFSVKNSLIYTKITNNIGEYDKIGMFLDFIGILL